MPKKKDKTKAKQNRFAPSRETLTASAGKVMGRKGEMSASHLAGPGKQVQLDIGVGQTVVIHWLQALGERVKSRVRAANNPQTTVCGYAAAPCPHWSGTAMARSQCQLVMGFV